MKKERSNSNITVSRSLRNERVQALKYTAVSITHTQRTRYHMPPEGGTQFCGVILPKKEKKNPNLTKLPDRIFYLQDTDRTEEGVKLHLREWNLPATCRQWGAWRMQSRSVFNKHSSRNKAMRGHIDTKNNLVMHQPTSASCIASA